MTAMLANKKTSYSTNNMKMASPATTCRNRGKTSSKSGQSSNPFQHYHHNKKTSSKLATTAFCSVLSLMIFGDVQVVGRVILSAGNGYSSARNFHSAPTQEQIGDRNHRITDIESGMHGRADRSESETKTGCISPLCGATSFLKKALDPCNCERSPCRKACSRGRSRSKQSDEDGRAKKIDHSPPDSDPFFQYRTQIPADAPPRIEMFPRSPLGINDARAPGSILVRKTPAEEGKQTSNGWAECDLTQLLVDTNLIGSTTDKTAAEIHDIGEQETIDKTATGETNDAESPVERAAGQNATAMMQESSTSTASNALERLADNSSIHPGLIEDSSSNLQQTEQPDNDGDTHSSAAVAKELFDSERQVTRSNLSKVNKAEEADRELADEIGGPTPPSSKNSDADSDTDVRNPPVEDFFDEQDTTSSLDRSLLIEGGWEWVPDREE